MTMTFKRNQLLLADTVGVEEAERLLEWLQGKRTVRVDLGACTHLHPANLQVLMAAAPTVTAWPADAGLASWLMPALDPTHAHREV